MEVLLKGGAATDLVDKSGLGSPGARRGRKGNPVSLWRGKKEDAEEEESFENLSAWVVGFLSCFVQFLDVIGCYHFVLDTSVGPSISNTI